MLAASNAIFRLVLAPPCAACGEILDRPLSGPVCPACWRSFGALTPPFCVICGDVMPAWRAAHPLCARCRRLPPAFEIARSAGRYDARLRELIHAFKYGRRRGLAGPLATLLRSAGVDLLAGATAVVPIPLHSGRAWHRGFNQADDLARQLGLPVWRLLRRTRAGPPQASLPASRRHANVRGAFALSRRAALARAFGSRALHSATLVLIDDVMTTGATMGVCAEVLREAGVGAVRALTVARAVAARPEPRPPPRHLWDDRHR
jgi:ComF family protein